MNIRLRIAPLFRMRLSHEGPLSIDGRRSHYS